MTISRAAPNPPIAVLGPTNTGKTHLAIERMLAHADGMIGLPLRLLAREVYDKIVAKKGAAAVALITGEERIAPDTARYFVCTAEAMPMDRQATFLAVDEIQLAADPDRGHVFTDRLLRARGTGETMLLGSDVMRPLIRQLLPSARIERRERFSTLSYSGQRKITKLPKRSAIVAFSAEEVYAIAELIRRQRGGAAVVMGALSPRTRNAQAELYQSGEVDFLVATDAIGMGINLDVDHVAFASRAKFDGRRHRVLRPEEIAQIAGRAGRFQNDGTFGETGDCAPLDEETIARVENHEFEPVVAIEWRNPHLNFHSITALQASLAAPPDRLGLMRVRGAVDEETLRRLALDPDIADRITSPGMVRRLWELCLTPDFRKTTIEEHARLISAMAAPILDGRRIAQAWIAREVEKLERVEGDLDALQARLAHMRTWSYVANRADWLDDAQAWRERTRQIEDRLSDALHAVLTQRFIDRRTSALLRGLKRDDALLAGVSADGEVTVEGHYVGRLEGLDFRPDPHADGREGRAVRYAALKALGPEVDRRLAAIAAAEDADFSLDKGGVRHAGALVARLAGGHSLTRPKLELIGGEAADQLGRRRALARLEAWVGEEIARELWPLLGLESAPANVALSPAAKGLAFRLFESGGALDRREAPALLRTDRAALAGLGVRIGRHTIHAPALTRPRALALKAALDGGAGFRAPRKALSAPLSPGRSWADYAAAGFRPAGACVVRIDALERLAGAARGAAQKNGREFHLSERWARLIGASPEDLRGVLKALGYRRVAAADAAVGLAERWRFPSLQPVRPAAATPTDNAFVGLADLIEQRRKAGDGAL
jgi:ATP-dependent RNA helicase SUPV3L1/SUV3